MSGPSGWRGNGDNRLIADGCADSRSAAVRADAVSRERMGLGEFWTRLSSGRVKVTGSFSDESRYFLTFTAVKVCARGLRASRVRFLERCLLGESRKLVTADFQLSQSTIAEGIAQCLRRMGLKATGSRVPLLLVVAVHASWGQGSVRTARRSDVPGTADQVISIPRPDRALARRLSAAEVGVVLLLVEGENYARIARHRGTSVHTVANQVVSAFYKLGVSGRSQLLHQVALAYDAATSSQGLPAS